jgi:hypothetical protein
MLAGVSVVVMIGRVEMFARNLRARVVQRSRHR